ncbi:MAG: hypothetical protein QOI93_5132 [Rhodospirillaceae bacterium]|jgi:hypothetical protein|nr:hypothetical protein [Rhodospirillaceae bacterium]
MALSGYRDGADPGPLSEVQLTSYVHGCTLADDAWIGHSCVAQNGGTEKSAGLSKAPDFAGFLSRGLESLIPRRAVITPPAGAPFIMTAQQQARPSIDVDVEFLHDWRDIVCGLLDRSLEFFGT